jgi:glycosyltransferase involved in cell wall biosynthesis
MERVKTRSYSRIVIHELSNYKHCLETGRLALLPSFRLAVTFLDVQDLYYPECFNDGILTRRRVGYAFFRERADVFFAISEFTKTTMVDRLRIDADRIKVVHLAGDDIARTVPSAEARQRAEAFGRYWIYPAKAWPHKNHALLFRALEARRDALKRSGVRLLLTGGFSSKDVRYLTDLAATCHVRDIVKVLGFQAQADLRALIERAEMMVFPSLFEGFGMPVLEAMVLGCPVACSRATALPEIGGDSALYFDPYSSESLIGVVEDVLAGHVDLAGLARRGKANALRFSWAETYQATIRGYEALLC